MLSIRRALGTRRVGDFAMASRVKVPPGTQDVGMCRGIIDLTPGTWEIPVVSSAPENRGLPGNSNCRQQSDMVSPGVGNEVLRDERREALALDSTDEAGELSNPTEARGGLRDVGL